MRPVLRMAATALVPATVLLVMAGCRQGEGESGDGADSGERTGRIADAPSLEGADRVPELSRRLLSPGSRVKVSEVEMEELVAALDSIKVEEFEAAADEVRLRIEGLVIGVLDGPRAASLEVSVPLAGKFLTGEKYAAAVENAFGYRTRFDPIETIGHLMKVKPGVRERTVSTPSFNISRSRRKTPLPSPIWSRGDCCRATCSV